MIYWIDVHGHLFGHNDISDEFLRVKLPMTAVFIDAVSSFFGCTKYGRFLNVLNDSSYFKWIDYRRTMLAFFGTPGKMVVLPIDFEHNGGLGGLPIRDYKGQMETTTKLCESGVASKETFLFDYITSEECVHGFKVYSSLSGLTPLHHVEKMAIANKPVTAHCAYGSLRHSEVSRREGRELNHPKHWMQVLKEIPELRLNLAHFCGEEEWEKYNKGKDSWVHVVLDLMGKYPNVFADLSYSIMFKEVRDGVSKALVYNKDLKNRILFGTDWYMCETERAGLWGTLQGYDSLGIWPEMYENARRFLGISSAEVTKYSWYVAK